MKFVIPTNAEIQSFNPLLIEKLPFTRSRAPWECIMKGGKYNQLLRIEEELGSIAQYAGMAAFYNLKA